MDIWKTKKGQYMQLVRYLAEKIKIKGSAISLTSFIIPYQNLEHA